MKIHIHHPDGTEQTLEGTADELRAYMRQEPTWSVPFVQLNPEHAFWCATRQIHIGDFPAPCNCGAVPPITFTTTNTTNT